MLAKLSSSLPRDDERWAYEMKWDGIRGLAFIEQGKLRLMTRNQIEVTRRYPELRGLANELGSRGLKIGFSSPAARLRLFQSISTEAVRTRMAELLAPAKKSI